MLLDIQGDMEAIKNTKKQMEKLNELEEENFCLEECGRNIYFECNNTCTNLLMFRKGLAEGRKEICKTCEQRLKELDRPCAFRSLGNEYCWE